MPTLETAFSVWRDDANQLDKARLPDVQIPLMALVGVYACVANVPKNAYAFRKSVVGDNQLCASLAAVIPENLRYEFEDEVMFPISIVRVNENAHERSRVEDVVLMDGLPETEETISSREYFLTRFLGQTAYNYAIGINPLRLMMQVAQPPMQYYFPKSLSLIGNSS